MFEESQSTVLPSSAKPQNISKGHSAGNITVHPLIPPFPNEKFQQQ